MKNTIPIAFAFDDSLVMPAVVCMTSLLENSRNDTFYDIFVIHSPKVSFADTPLTKLSSIYSNCKISFIEVETNFDASYEVRGITTPTYYRLLIPDLISEYDKILYSDVDVIFRDDMSDFYNQDLDGYYLGGVDNCSFLRPDVQQYIKQELGLDYNKGYFYAGNIVMNLSLMRQDKVVDKFKALSGRKYLQQDMDILNIVCNGKIKSLSPEFCVTNYIYELILSKKNDLLSVYAEQDLSNAIQKGIIHYNGPKPWSQWCQNFDIWWDYYRKSCCFNELDALNFYKNRMKDIYRLSLWKRVKLLFKYFIYGKAN